MRYYSYGSYGTKRAKKIIAIALTVLMFIKKLKSADEIVKLMERLAGTSAIAYAAILLLCDLARGRHPPNKVNTIH